jgi:hypothetical protein
MIKTRLRELVADSMPYKHLPQVSELHARITHPSA